MAALSRKRVATSEAERDERMNKKAASHSTSDELPERAAGSQLLPSLDVSTTPGGASRSLPAIGGADAHVWVHVLARLLELELRLVGNFFWLFKQNRVRALADHFFGLHASAPEFRVWESGVMQFARVSHAARQLVATEYCQTELALVVDRLVAEVELVRPSLRTRSNFVRFSMLPFAELSVSDALALNVRRFAFVRFAVNAVVTSGWSLRVGDDGWYAALYLDAVDGEAREAHVAAMQQLCLAAAWFREHLSSRAMRSVLLSTCLQESAPALVGACSVLRVTVFREHSHTVNMHWPVRARDLNDQFALEWDAHRARERAVAEHRRQTHQQYLMLVQQQQLQQQQQQQHMQQYGLHSVVVDDDDEEDDDEEILSDPRSQ